MGLETCLESNGELCSLNFSGKKSCLGSEFEDPPNIMAQANRIFSIPILVASILSTCASETDSE